MDMLRRIIILALCPLFLGGRMFEPSKFDGNHLYEALLTTTQVSREGISNVDVTRIFANALNGLTFPTIIAEMRQLGAIWPLPVPAPGTKSGIAVEYDELKKIPGAGFKPYDTVRVFLDIKEDEKVLVSKAVLVNTAAFP